LQKGGRGDLSVAGTQKSPSIPLLKRGRLVKFPNGLSGLNMSSFTLLEVIKPLFAGALV